MAQTREQRRLGAAKRRMRDWLRFNAFLFHKEQAASSRDLIQYELRGLWNNLGGGQYATSKLHKVAQELGLAYAGPNRGLYVPTPENKEN